MNSPPSVLFISNHGDIVGGGEISLLQLIGALNGSEWKPVLIVPHEGAVAKEARNSEIPTFVVPMPAVSGTSMASVSSIRALWRLIRQEDAQIIHANGTRAMMYGGLAAKIAQRPAIWHVRVADSDGWLDRALYQFSAKIVVNLKRCVTGSRGELRIACDVSTMGSIQRGLPHGVLRLSIELLWG